MGRLLPPIVLAFSLLTAFSFGEELSYPEAGVRPFPAGTAFKIGSQLVIPEGSTCARVISISSDLRVLGRVRGWVLALFADVEIGGSAEVGGDLIVVGGRLKLDPNAKVLGRTVVLSKLEAIDKLVSLASGLPRPYWGNFAWISWKTIHFICMLILQVILFLIFPARTEAMARCVQYRPIGTFVLSGLIALAIIPVSLFLLLTIVGIPVLILLWAVLVAAAVFGKLGVFAALGNILFQTERTSILSILFGYTIYRIITFLPVVGKPIFLLVTALSIGVCVRTGFGRKEVLRKGGREVGRY